MDRPLRRPRAHPLRQRAERPTCSTRSTAGSRRAGSSRRRSPRSPRSWASARSTSAPTCSTSATARPGRATLWAAAARRRPGSARRSTFGDPVPNQAIPELPLIDEVALGTPPDAADPPPGRRVPRRAARARSCAPKRPSGVMLMAGSGEGIVDAAAAGIIVADQPVLYSATFADDPDGMQRALDDGAQLVLTDTNRRQARRWGTVRENVGYTERAGEEALDDDPTDNRLEVFPGAGDETQTVVEQRGVVRVDATAYGNPVSYTPDDRPANALDGDPRTAWRVGAFSDVTGERWEVELEDAGDHRPPHLAAADHRLAQPVHHRGAASLRRPRRPRRRCSTSRHGPLRASASRSARTPSRRCRSRCATPTSATARATGASARWASPRSTSPASASTRSLRLPTDLLTAAGTASIDHDLDVVMTRQRSEPRRAGPHRRRGDVDPAGRSTCRPAREFAIEGDARLSARAPDTVLDTLLGRPDAEAGGVTATSTARLDGDLTALASSAIDGDDDDGLADAVRVRAGQRRDLHRGRAVHVRPPRPHRVRRRTALRADRAHDHRRRRHARGRGRAAPSRTIRAGRTRPRPCESICPSRSRRRSSRSSSPRSAPSRRSTTTPRHAVTMPVGDRRVGHRRARGAAARHRRSTRGCDSYVEINGEAVEVRATGDTADVLARRRDDADASAPAATSTCPRARSASAPSPARTSASTSTASCCARQRAARRARRPDSSRRSRRPSPSRAPAASRTHCGSTTRPSRSGSCSARAATTAGRPR